ncbi:MAG: hypothetical protein COX48_01420 [bacterium (Candidatus Stahlbacteria) CG23_combo_of_CG06-09_8_20_14_all_34_7]|nr:MAG: hypothetical protein COX48_01420 [bacterium (Candidatus Stahlbacteria) CG23_combo_of_CG06-09_8_20_14_all_34_7]
MMNFPSDVLLQFVPIDNANRSLMTGVYSLGTFYVFEEYRENNIISPGLFIDYKEYANDYLIVKNSIDGIYERYLFLQDFSNTKIEGSTKWMVGLPIKISLHLNGFLGYKISSSDNNILKWALSPLISINLFNSIGLSVSGTYSKATDDTLDYYIDDSFLDEYFYDETNVMGKATVLFGESNKLILSASYSMRDYLTLYHTVDTETFLMGEYESRHDDILLLNVTMKIKLDSNSPYINYTYEKRNSWNLQYSFNSNSLTLGIEF